MKIVINKTGNIEEVENKLALRMTNRGTAHPIRMGGIVDLNKIPKLHNDLILNTTQVKKFKEIIPKKELIDIPDEIFEVPKKRSKRKKKKLENNFKQG